MLKKKFNQPLSIFFTTEWRLNIKYWTKWGCELQFFTQIKICQYLKTLPILNETILKDALRITSFFSEWLKEIKLKLLSCLFISLHILRYIRKYWWRNNVRSIFPSKADFSIERPYFHYKWNSIEMIKSIWNIHYCRESNWMSKF